MLIFGIFKLLQGVAQRVCEHQRVYRVLLVDFFLNVLTMQSSEV